MELDWLQTFLAVVDRGGFTAASQQIHRSQSRVSAHIAALERELDVRLIDRSRRPATVTEVGRAFATHAREILDDVGRARHVIEAMRALEEGSIGLRATPSAGAVLFPGVLTEVMRRHPDARVVLREDAASGEVAQGDDPVMSVRPSTAPAGPRRQRQPLWRERLQLVVRCDHPLAANGRDIEPADLLDQPFVFGLMAGLPADEITELLSERQLGVRPRLTVDQPDTLVASVRAGLGIGVINSVASTTTDIAGLAIVHLEDPDTTSPDVGFDVIAEWSDVLLGNQVGRDLRAAVMAAPTPAGAIDLQDR